MKTKLFVLIIAMSLLSKILGATKLDAPVIERPKNHLAFVLLEKAELPSEEAILDAFAKYSQGTHTLSLSKNEDETSTEEKEERVLAMNIEGIGFAFIGLMPTPVPNGEAEAAFPFSISSFSGDNELSDHSAHLMVTLMLSEDSDPLESLMAYTSLLAAVTESSQSIGVYWGNAGATHTRDFFLSVASEHSINPRILLWNGISRAGEKGGKMSFLSYGMQQLALPNLYLVCNANEAGSYFSRFFDLISYIAERGESLPAGDTIGSTEEERIKVEYVKSPADDGQIVWKVVF